MNDRDSEALLGLFLEKGYQQAKSEEEADVVLVNTCSVREHAENRALSFAGKFKKIKQSRANKPLVGIIGCMAQNKGRDIFRKMQHLSLVCGPSTFNKIPGYIEKINKDRIRIIDLEDQVREDDFYRASFRFQKEWAQVVISTGCSNYCSYCVVPFVRGPLRLREPEDIINEVKRNISLGIKKITLLGQNVNDYKHERGNFVELLELVIEVPGVEEINFLTPHPKDTSRELFTFMAKSSKMKKHLHLPFQSGSNRILELMNRGYTKEDYLGLVSDYRKIVGGTLSTDVIAGFPTETDKDFKQTKEVIEEVKFRHAYIFKYSPRKRAKSFELRDDVPKETKEKRHKILLELQKKISLKNPKYEYRNPK
jgi:tRNA-2-methylthio-N6-dimethylallyladenosine synthase